MAPLVLVAVPLTPSYRAYGRSPQVPDPNETGHPRRFADDPTQWRR